MTVHHGGMADILGRGPVMAVVTIEDAACAPDLARALAAGGVTVIEVTLRTPAALDAIAAIARDPGPVIVGAGTCLGARDLDRAVAAGAQFAVSPGSPPDLLAAAHKEGLPFLPGIATPTEAMQAKSAGFEVLKVFPAEALGGPAFLRALAGPLPSLRFSPSGGVTGETAGGYLAVPNVLSVGASWLAPAEAVAAGNWARIEGLARTAAALRP